MRSISTRTCDRSAQSWGLRTGMGLTGLRRWIRAARDYALTSPLAIPLGVGGRPRGAVQIVGRFWIFPCACSFLISAHLALICSTVGGTILGTVISRVFICA